MVAIMGTDIGKVLYEAGLIPDNTRRIVIDIKYDSLVVVYYETLADKETMDITIENLIKHKDKIKIMPIPNIRTIDEEGL